MAKKLNIGIAGTGKFAHAHAKAIASIPTANLTAVFSSSQERADRFSGQYGIKGFSDLGKFLQANIDIVDIVTIHNRHAQIGIKAALAGKHLIIEKPMTSNLEDADKIIDICNKDNIKASIISQHRYDKAYLKAKEILDFGRLGKIIFASVLMRWHRPESYFKNAGKWLANPECAGGGVLMMQAVHFIDILTWLFGQATVIKGCIDTKTHNIDVEDTAIAMLEFEPKFKTLLMATVSASCNITDRLEIHGEKGSIIIEDHEFFKYIKPPCSAIDDYFKKVRFKLEKMLPFQFKLQRRLPCGTVAMQIQDIVRNIIDGSSLPNPPEEARKVLKTIFAIYESSKGK